MASNTASIAGSDVTGQHGVMAFASNMMAGTVFFGLAVGRDDEGESQASASFLATVDEVRDFAVSLLVAADEADGRLGVSRHNFDGLGHTAPAETCRCQATWVGREREV
jgi:hypothetical protein